MKMVAKAAFAALLLAQGASAVAEGKRIAFIGCPVMRDMDLPERPCWLAQDGDKLYFLGMQGDIFPPVIFFPPQLKHKALVEAELGEGKDICGGLPLKNVRVSVMPEIDLTCDTILPKAGFEQGPILRPSPPYRPGRGVASDPSTWEQADPNQRAPRPTPTSNAAAAPAPAPARVEEPAGERSFKLPFRFNSDFITLEEAGISSGALRYFQQSKASKMIIDVHRDRVALSNGQVIEEGPEVAKWRAALMVRNFTEWGLAPDRMEIRTDRQPEPGGAYLTLTVVP